MLFIVRVKNSCVFILGENNLGELWCEEVGRLIGGVVGAFPEHPLYESYLY